MKALALIALASLDAQGLARLFNLSLQDTPTTERKREPARLGLKLHGTLVANDERFSLALVERRSVVVGDTLEGRIVRAITRGCVLFDEEELCVQPRITAPADSSPKLHVALSDFAQWTQVRIVPVPSGFKLLSIPPGSIYEKLGVRSGDIVRKVNGKQVDFSALQLVHPGAQLTIELERNGLSFQLEGQLD